MIRIYYRVSTDKQDFEMQLNSIRRLCKEQSFDYDSCLVYMDYALSGTTSDRAQYQKLLSELVAYDTVLVYEFSRLWRDMSEQAPVTKKFRAMNITVLSPIDGRLDKDTDMFLVNIKGCVNQYEAERLRQRTIDGMKAKKARCEAGLDTWKRRGSDKKKRSTDGYTREQARRRALKAGDSQ